MACNGVQFWGMIGYCACFATFLYLSKYAYQANPSGIEGNFVNVSLLAFWMTELGVRIDPIFMGLIMSLLAFVALVTGRPGQPAATGS